MFGCGRRGEREREREIILNLLWHTRYENLRSILVLILVAPIPIPSNTLSLSVWIEIQALFLASVDDTDASS